MLSATKITKIFCSIDDFCLDFVPKFQKLLLGTKKRNKPSKLSLSEVMTIQVLFQLSGFRNFKTFYNSFACIHLRSFFPNVVKL